MAKRDFCPSLLSTAVSLVTVSLASGCHAQQPAGGAAPAAQLQPYTAPDQSASAGVPSGWKVTNGQQTVITMTGTQGETLSLGNTLAAQNGAFQAGKRGNGIDLFMPYTATLAQKLTMIVQQNAAVAGKPAPQLSIASSTPIQLPPALGQCGRFVAGVSGQSGAMKIMAVFCSLPPDSAGAYKNIMLLAQAPAATAAQSAPTAQAVFQSYRIPASWLQRKLAPLHAPPVAANSAAATLAAAKINSATIAGEVGADNSANCFDLAVLRQTPNYQLPRSCGGTKPD
jgi:hypothetical protein